MIAMMNEIQQKKRKVEIKQTDVQDIKWDFSSGDYKHVKDEATGKPKQKVESKPVKAADDGLFDDLNEDDY